MTASPSGTAEIHPLRVLTVLLLIMAGLAALDQFLERVETAEVQGAARNAWQRGVRLLRDKRAGEALEALRTAHSLDRDNAVYEVDMIAALTALGKFPEADSLMDEVLQRKPNDGQANLTAGRLRAKEGDMENAEAYYHRAIYGEWPGDAAPRRRDTRLELVQFLIDHHSKQELLAELISLEADSGGDEALERRIAQLFLVADAPARAAALYRSLIAKKPDDASAYVGLGEAEMQVGAYRPARSAFLQASWHHPEVSVAPRLILLNEVIQLDPTPRRLPTAEKYERSLRILALAVGDLKARLERQSTAPPTGEAAVYLKSAADASVPARNPTNEMAEQNLDLAERIWKLRLQMFGPSTDSEEEALRLIMERLAG